MFDLCKVTNTVVACSRQELTCPHHTLLHVLTSPFLDQIVKKHDVDSAVRVLFKNAGPKFQEHVVKWGAVHADDRR